MRRITISASVNLGIERAVDICESFGPLQSLKPLYCDRGFLIGWDVTIQSIPIADGPDVRARITVSEQKSQDGLRRLVEYKLDLDEYPDDPAGEIEISKEVKDLFAGLGNKDKP